MSGVDPRRMADAYSPNFGLPWTPVVDRSITEKMPIEQLYKYYQDRKEVEALVASNPTGAGWILPSWKILQDNFGKYNIHIILGGNRSGKSTLASRICVWALGTIPEAEVRCFHVNSDRSQQDQQRLVWEALPDSIKNMPVKKGQYHSIAWNQRTGFTNDLLILPPLPGWKKGGRIDFQNYKSYENDAQIAEGFKAHVVWGDEEMPVKLFDTLTYRTTDYHGRIILTFTTIDGWTPLVQDILGKTKTLAWRNAPMLKNRRIPVLQESLSRPGALIHYFWSEDNPFIDVNEFRSKLKGRPEDEILCRAYGIPTKTASAVFTMFDRGVNVVKHEDLPFVKKPDYPVTRYLGVDPAGSRNYFCLWVAIDAAGTWWVYDEWPDYGEWALPGATIEGKPGPAQKTLGYGIRDYAELFKNKEGEKPVFERIIDPRMSAAEKQSEEGATTIISDFDKQDMTFIPAPGVDIDNGLQILAGLLKWNPEKPRDAINSPKLFVSERCQNFIYAMCEYTARGGSNEATKDPIDCARYLAVSNISFFKKEDLIATGDTGSY